jgi:uncharacterized protein (DUF2141 family)
MKTLIILFLFSFSLSAVAHDLKIVVENIAPIRGTLKMALFPENSDFPSDYNSAEESIVLNVQSSTIRHTFSGLRPGIYAVALFHDLNENDTLDTNFLGIPLEPFGLSNNPRLFGRPTFKKCQFALEKNLELKIILKTLL